MVGWSYARFFYLSLSLLEKAGMCLSLSTEVVVYELAVRNIKCRAAQRDAISGNMFTFCRQESPSAETKLEIRSKNKSCSGHQCL